MKFSGSGSRIAISPDGQTLYTSSFGDKTATAWNVNNGMEILRFCGHSRSIN